MLLLVLDHAALFVSHVFVAVSAMNTAQVKAQCVLWLAELRSVVLVQRTFRGTYYRDPPTDKTLSSLVDQELRKTMLNACDLPFHAARRNP